MTFRKILNVHSAERNEHFLSWKALKTLWQRRKLLIVAKEEIFQMSSAASDIKTSIYGVKG